MNMAKEKNPEHFTNAIGAPVPDNTNILTAGRRGPALLQDIWLIEKLAHFDREVIPERRMHAKGWGRMGRSRQRTTSPSTPRKRFFRGSERRRRCSRAFRASLGNAGQPMRSAISAALLSSSTLKREIGTSSETILQSFSSAILFASLTSTTRS